MRYAMMIGICLTATGLFATEAIVIDELQVEGRLVEDQLSLQLSFVAEVKNPKQDRLLVRGPVLLGRWETKRSALDYDRDTQTYAVRYEAKGKMSSKAMFYVQATRTEDAWRQAQLQLARARITYVTLVCDRPDLAVELPGALRVERVLNEAGQLSLKAILGPDQAFKVRWQPQVTLADAKLVVSSQANTIVDVRAGRLHVDTLFDFQAAQGQMESLAFKVPEGLRITSVDGQHIRNWSMATEDTASQKLQVILSQPQKQTYRLAVRAEAVMGVLPAEVAVPLIEPMEGSRVSGTLAVGTDNALQLVVRNAAGLTQIDGAAFPRIKGTQTRNVPQGKAFFYTYAGTGPALRLAVDDIVPSFDVASRLVVMVKEDDLLVDAEMELDVRDAPLRHLDVCVPSHWIIAAVQGQQVDDYQMMGGEQEKMNTVRTMFKKPVQGRTVLKFRLELGRDPLDAKQTIPPLDVLEAKTHRGYVVVASEAGINMTEPNVTNLREVHTASVPIRVPEAQFAYRFRQTDWQLELQAQRKSAGIRAEVFHLQSIGETLAYGSAVINYIITGSPVDRLSFRLPKELKNVEFVGRDVRRWDQNEDQWEVQLTRKVIGEYNLAVTYTQPYDTNTPIQLGTLECEQVQTQTGYVAVTSFLDLKLGLQTEANDGVQGLIPLALDELPADYRLLTRSPILATYKYVTPRHTARLSVSPYQRAELLPVVLDMASHHTQLAVRPDGQIESVTRVRYKVKNATGQFMALAMPADSQVWSVSRLEQGAQGKEAVRLAASHDQATGRLLIPLRRQVNPNDPMTVELTYGQIHGTGRGWSTQVALDAPRSDVPMTYADWHVKLPAAWSVTSAGGTMQVTQTIRSGPNLSLLLLEAGEAWGEAFEKAFRGETPFVVGGVAVLLLVLCGIFRRPWLPELSVVLLIILGGGLGVLAFQEGIWKAPQPLTQAQYTQAVNADPAQALHAEVTLMPAWRANLSMHDLVIVPLMTIVAIGLGLWWRRWAWVSFCIVGAVSLYGAAKLATAWFVLQILLTWGPIAVLALWCLGRGLVRLRAVPTVPAVATTLFILLSVGCNKVEATETNASLLDRVDCNLVAGKDHMQVTYQLEIHAQTSATYHLVSGSSVLVSDPKPQKYVTVSVQGGYYAVTVSRGGRYQVDVQFLMPLERKPDQAQQRFALNLPVALTNEVRLELPETNVRIEADKAVSWLHASNNKTTVMTARFEPGTPAVFTWKPEERRASEEDVQFYAQDIALAKLSSGLIQVTHGIHLQIAQGQVEAVTLDVLPGETVTAVEGKGIGAWRYEPSTRKLEVHLTTPVTGAYRFKVVTQSPSASVPYSIALGPMRVCEAQGQHSVLGLLTDAAVAVNIDSHPAKIHTQDFMRDCASAFATFKGGERIQQAYRFDGLDARVEGSVVAVPSELRSQETARFNVEDERLVYNSQWRIEIAKAGRFDIVLGLPSGYDIDALNAPQVSHWDEIEDAQGRQVRVHFQNKLTGTVELMLALSKPISEIPQSLSVPRVTLVDVLKHTGDLLIAGERGIRLAVAERQGVSETNPMEGKGQPGQLAFRLLRPDWHLSLQTELVQARITAQTLHIADVTDGLVRHRHSLRYRLYHAGAKTFDLGLPTEASGVTITGANIARREQIQPGQWRVELTEKVYQQPTLLRVTYETRFDPIQGQVRLTPIQCLNADQQQGHTVVFATERVALAAQSLDAAWRPAEARSIPKVFGAGDLSNAVLCYRHVSVDQPLQVLAQRHQPAEQVGAEVRQTALSTVVTESGQTLTQVTLSIVVGSQRHLQTRQPESARIWSLTVDGQATQPSMRVTSDGETVTLIPLPQQAGEAVTVALTYVTDLLGLQQGGGSWAGTHALAGPRFNVPLNNIRWQLYVPEGYAYSDFGGTLTFDKRSVPLQIYHYDLNAYEDQIQATIQENTRRAQSQQSLARSLAQKGEQSAARQALAKGVNYSRGNRALNEDIRVDLDNLLRQQAKVALVNTRSRLQQQEGGAASNDVAVGGTEMQFSQQQAERIESSLGQADNENLDLITYRILQAQEAAQAAVAQLDIPLPTCGRGLWFESPLQVEPNADMIIRFQAKAQASKRMDAGMGAGIGSFFVLFIIGGGIHVLRRYWDRLHAWLTPAPKEESEEIIEDIPPHDDGPITAAELI